MLTQPPADSPLCWLTPLLTQPFADSAVCWLIGLVTWQGLHNFDEILAEADGVILSRGNLGIDLPAEKVKQGGGLHSLISYLSSLVFNMSYLIPYLSSSISHHLYYTFHISSLNLSSLIFHISSLILNLSPLIFNLSSPISHPFTSHLPSPTTFQLLSSIFHVPSLIFPLPPTTFHLPSLISHLPSSIFHLPSSIHKQSTYKPPLVTHTSLSPSRCSFSRRLSFTSATWQASQLCWREWWTPWRRHRDQPEQRQPTWQTRCWTVQTQPNHQTQLGFFSFFF